MNFWSADNFSDRSNRDLEYCDSSISNTLNSKATMVESTKGKIKNGQLLLKLTEITSVIVHSLYIGHMTPPRCGDACKHKTSDNPIRNG